MRELIFLAPLMLAACAAAPAPADNSDIPVRNDGTCNAAPAQGYVGQMRSDANAAAIQAASGASIFRWLPPGTIVTMEFNGNRVNAHLDEAGKITKIVCG